MKINLPSYIEHSFLLPTATIADIELLCNEAVQNNFVAICVPPIFVKKAKQYLQNSSVNIATVIGFPFGYSAIEAKLAEIVLAIIDGADELDVVINLAALKNNDWQYLAHELNTILPVVQSKQKKLKIIIEAGELTKSEIIQCCDLYGIAGIHYLQTATGFAANGATIEIVETIRTHLTNSVAIKVHGNINNDTFAKELISAGANRIGTNSGR